MVCGGVLEDMRGDIFFEPEADAHRGGKPRPDGSYRPAVPVDQLVGQRGARR